jgi:hypothetical protein
MVVNPLVPVHSEHILGANSLVPLFVLSLNHLVGDLFSNAMN